jgi:hypothetical protein
MLLKVENKTSVIPLTVYCKLESNKVVEYSVIDKKRERVAAEVQRLCSPQKHLRSERFPPAATGEPDGKHLAATCLAVWKAVSILANPHTSSCSLGDPCGLSVSGLRNLAAAMRNQQQKLMVLRKHWS